jgi:serine-type D-Ala-D-Ala carboxypeptidase (penicillin-binding protein 5/6)
MKSAYLAPILALVAIPMIATARPKHKALPVPPTPPTVFLPDPAAISAKSAVILDGVTGRVLWGKEPDKAMYPASTTKIMTAMLLIEHCKEDELITAPANIKTIGESSMHLQPGEQLSMRNLLWGILLRSANDGCYDAAIHVGGTIPGFAKMMNDRAAEIGCTNTHFTNPNGLHDPKHWTSAHDLALMAREAFKLPLFAEVVKNNRHQIARSMNTKDVWMVSKNHFIGRDPTADGVKTGYTVPAGHTYVGSATRGGYRIITAIMKSDHWELDHDAMLKWAFANFDHLTVARKGDAVPDISIDGAAQPKVSGTLADDVQDCVPKGSASQLTATFEPDKISAPVQAGQKLGNEVYSDGSGYTVRVPVLASADVAKASVMGKVAGRSTSYYVIGSSLCLGLFWFRSRTRRSRFYGKSPSRKGNFTLFS